MGWEKTLCQEQTFRGVKFTPTKIPGVWGEVLGVIRGIKRSPERIWARLRGRGPGDTFPVEGVPGRGPGDQNSFLMDVFDGITAHDRSDWEEVTGTPPTE